MKFRSYMKFLCTDGGRSSKRLPDSLKREKVRDARQIVLAGGD